ncbi:hypothetical protein [Aquabacterium sp.]|uniref:hypothetical protein n=1 Tax=Aquabacterium sp. TaxID=1872578 RepID=UPI00262E4230|nr:hypothetical protein [Aquabacterium sp.]MDD2975686.1 hypothetical protein [Aquabacterium sp.]
MKDARPSINTESSATAEGAPIVSPFGFPAKLDTVCAEVLRRLLSGERLTSLDAVGEASTTRLSAHVFYLGDSYAWPIESIDKAAGCKDGRVTYVSEYFLPPTVIAHAAERGAAQWCAKVRAARLKLRANAAKAKHRAELFNRVAAKRRQDAEQCELFEVACHE